MTKIRIVIEVIAKYTICIALLFMAGCSGKAQQIFRDTSYKINYIDYTNYKIGEEKTAPIGDPIIEMKKHRRKTQLNAAVRPTQDMKITRTTCVALAGQCEEFLPADRDYEVLREVLFEDNEYYVVSASRNKISKLDATTYSNSGWQFLVGKNGRPLDRVFIAGPDTVLLNSLTIEPPGAKLEIKDRVVIDTKGFIEESIIFTGFNNGTINIRYISRGYDEADNRIDRQEDYQLPKAVEIRFKRYLFKIIDVRTDAIKFIVVSDSY